MIINPNFRIKSLEIKGNKRNLNDKKYKLKY